jgi:hypothetical protein
VRGGGCEAGAGVAAALTRGRVPAQRHLPPSPLAVRGRCGVRPAKLCSPGACEPESVPVDPAAVSGFHERLLLGVVDPRVSIAQPKVSRAGNMPLSLWDP